jgi:hypothetical protein
MFFLWKSIFGLGLYLFIYFDRSPKCGFELGVSDHAIPILTHFFKFRNLWAWLEKGLIPCTTHSPRLDII